MFITLQIRVEIPNLYNRLARMHKTRDGMAFNVLGVTFAAAMILICISGIMICWKSIKLQQTMFISLSFGLLITVIAVLLSM